MSSVETSLTVGLYCLTVGSILSVFPVPSTVGVICVWLLGLATVMAVAQCGSAESSSDAAKNNFTLITEY